MRCWNERCILLHFGQRLWKGLSCIIKGQMATSSNTLHLGWRAHCLDLRIQWCWLRQCSVTLVSPWEYLAGWGGGSSEPHPMVLEVSRTLPDNSQGPCSTGDWTRLGLMQLLCSPPLQSPRTIFIKLFSLVYWTWPPSFQFVKQIFLHCFNSIWNQPVIWFFCETAMLN